MKKLMIAAAMVCAAAFAQAATVDWKVTGSETADVGKTIYILTSYSATYDSVSAFTDTTIASAAIKSKTTRGVTTYATDKMVTGDTSITKTGTYYLAVVSDDEKTVYFYQGDNAKVYDTAAQESSPGALTVALSAIEGSAKTASIPEPTSGLLLLLGMAGLALKRKRA